MIQFLNDGMPQNRQASLLPQIICVAVLIGCMTGWCNAQEATGENQIETQVSSYFKKYCYRCHGQAAQKGDRRLDQLPDDLSADGGAVELLREALDAISRGDMPPQEKGVVQPPIDQTRKVVVWLTEYMDQAARNQSSPATIMRRLNRFEYLNTLRDLLSLQADAFDPTGDFPADAKEHGFDNNGEALTLSDFQLQRYVEVAEEALEETIFFDREKPKSEIWHYTGRDFNGVKSYQRAPVTWRLIVNDEYVEIGHGQPSERHANFVKSFVKQGGVPADGWYTISIRASAANRLDHGYDHSEFKRFEKFPLKLALWVAPNFALLGKNAADQRRLVKVWDLPDGEPEVFTQRVWLGKGAIPFVSWTNGISSKGNILRVAREYHPEVIRATKTQLDSAQLGNADAKAVVAELSKNENNKLLSEVYHGPRIRVWGMEIEGPLFKQWPPASHRTLFGTETDATRVDIDQTVKRFASRAFRRPMKSGEVQHYVDFIRNRIKQGDTHAAAIKLGLTAILTSPRFLYLDEGNDEAGDLRLNQWELASRLSYFLWSSMPDATLFAAAKAGKLSNQQELASQVDRMLNDEKAKAFVEHFTDNWLRLNILGSMPPDSKAFGSYYQDRLESFFKQETRSFFADLLHSNGSILNFLQSDYTYVNDAVARHYGIDGVVGEHFRRVDLKPEHHRGGLLGQGSVLTLTANGIETSPVVRGVWVLENIFGTPPSPPPPDVEPLEPDTRGTTTIREQLKKHRNVVLCADCHRKIDPGGFALELYDPVGAFRTRYRTARGNGPSVDSSGQLPSGEIFQDEREFKNLLLKRKDRFAETLAEKLLTHATGRTMNYRDRDEIKKVAAECAESGFGLRGLVHGITQSDIFQTR